MHLKLPADLKVITLHTPWLHSSVLSAVRQDKFWKHPPFFTYTCTKWKKRWSDGLDGKIMKDDEKEIGGDEKVMTVRYI